MTKQDHDPDQMRFADLDHLPRVTTRRVHDLGITVIESTASPHAASPARNEKVMMLRWLLLKYMRVHGVGHEFQAIDFSHWARQQPQFDQTIDLRSAGGMFRQFVGAGLFEQVGFRNNGGDKETGYHGTPRAVYRIVCNDASKLGWPEDLSGIEQRGVWTDTQPPRRRATA